MFQRNTIVGNNQFLRAGIHLWNIGDFLQSVQFCIDLFAQKGAVAHRLQIGIDCESAEQESQAIRPADLPRQIQQSRRRNQHTAHDLKGQSIETITLEEVLELFKLPRTLGEYEGKTVSVGIGRFGPYVLHNKVYVSLPKTMDPMEITLEEAEQLILEKRTKEAERHIKKFAEEPELEILNGRYGPYIAYKGNNYKIPKDIVPQDLSLHSCMELIRIQDEKGVTSAPKKKFAKKK